MNLNHDGHGGKPGGIGTEVGDPFEAFIAPSETQHVHDPAYLHSFVHSRPTVSNTCGYTPVPQPATRSQLSPLSHPQPPSHSRPHHPTAFNSLRQSHISSAPASASTATSPDPPSVSSNTPPTVATPGPSKVPKSTGTRKERNTAAARRYRQRKLDRVTELEEALSKVMKERDELKLRLAKSEGEGDVLRGLLRDGRC